MGGLESGKYWIQHSYYHRLRHGIDDLHEPVVPVISYGHFIFFVIKKLQDGKYTIEVQENDRVRYIQACDDHVVANVDGPPSVWEISGLEDGTCTIKVPSPIRPTKGWTIDTQDPYVRKPVTLQFVEIPTPDQKFDFVHFGDE